MSLADELGIYENQRISEKGNAAVGGRVAL
jgi:hypothetical protein